MSSRPRSGSGPPLHDECVIRRLVIHDPPYEEYGQLAPMTLKLDLGLLTGIELKSSFERGVVKNFDGSSIDRIAFSACILLCLVASTQATHAAMGQGDSPLFSLDTSIASFDDSPLFSLETRTGVGVAGDGPTATRIRLAPCQPNPFNPATVIRYELGNEALVDLVVFDLRGRRVRTLRRGSFENSGWHEVRWDGRDNSGRRVAGGVYVCKLQAAGKSVSITMTMVK